MAVEQERRASTRGIGAVIRVNLAKSWCEALIQDGSLPVEWLAAISRPVQSVTVGVTTLNAVEVTPEMWDFFLVWCHRRRTVTLGASRGEEDFAVLAGRLYDKVSDVLNRMAQHPGYKGRAIRSHSAVVLPAYRCKHPRARWWPTPRMAVQHAEGDSLEVESGWLVPEQKMVRGSLVTKWRLDPDHPSYYSEGNPTERNER